MCRASVCVYRISKEKAFYENRSRAFWCAIRRVAMLLRACMFVYTQNQDVQLQLLVFTNGLRAPRIVALIAVAHICDVGAVVVCECERDVNRAWHSTRGVFLYVFFAF